MTNADEQRPSLFNTTTHDAELVRQRNELVAAATTIKANETPAFSVDLDVASAELVARTLSEAKDKGEAQLSYALYVLRSNKAYLNAGYDTFNRYVEDRIRISASRASVLASRWEAFIEVGLSANVLTGNNPVAWNKFGELVPGVKAGIIDHANVDIWLPLIAVGGDYALSNSNLNRLVKAEIANTKAEANPEQVETFTIRTTADVKANILRYIHTIQEATGILSTDDAIIAALESKVTEIASNTADVRVNYGLTRFQEIAERMAPGIRVIFLADSDSGYTEDSLGVVPYTRLYTTQPLDGGCVLAINEEEAKETLGDTVYATELSVTVNPETAPTVAEEELIIVEEEPIFVEEEPIFVEEEPIFVEEEPIFVEDEPIFVEEEPIFVEEGHASEEEVYEEVEDSVDVPVDPTDMTAREIAELNRELARELVAQKALTMDDIRAIKVAAEEGTAINSKARALAVYTALDMQARNHGVYT